MRPEHQLRGGGFTTMDPPFRLHATSSLDRFLTTLEIKEAGEKAHAWILAANSFSNVSICFSLEVRTTRLATLAKALEASPLRFNRTSQAQLRAWQSSSPPDTPMEEEARGTLEVTLLTNEPDLRIEVPPIPG